MKTRYVARHRKKPRFSTVKKAVALSAATLASLSLCGYLGKTEQPTNPQPDFQSVKTLQSMTMVNPRSPWLQIMPAGDSITRGVLRENGTYVARNGYRADLWVRLFNETKSPNFVGSCPDSRPERSCPLGSPPQMGDYNHEGHDGWTVAMLDQLVPIAVNAYQPKAILLLTGANDLRSNRTPLQYKTDLIDLLNDVYLVKPDVHIFLASPTFKGNESDWWSYVQEVHNVVNTFVALGKSISLVPLHIIGQNDMVPGQIHWGELSDGVHPTACGYARIAYIWFYYMQRSRVTNPTGESWATNLNYPFNSPATGACAGIT